jgi:hypothetical protein
MTARMIIAVPTAVAVLLPASIVAFMVTVFAAASAILIG